MILGRSAPTGHVALLHGDTDRGEGLARMLRSAGHRVTLVPEGRRVPQTVVEASPDLLVASLTFTEPPVAGVIRAARQALGAELPVLVVVGREDSDSLVEADEIIREPVDPGELDLRVGGLLRHQAERRFLQRKVDELLGLYKISWAFSLAAGPEGLFGHLAAQSAQLLRAQKGLVLLFERERRQMVAQTPGFGIAPEVVGRVRYPVDGEARSRWNFRKNGPLIANKPQSDSRLLPDMATELDLHSLLIAPLVRGPQVTGLILVADRHADSPFTDEDLNLLLAVAGEASVAVENMRLHEELKRANALLQEYDRLKSEFVAIVAHDFRKPLMAIRGFAELVLEEPDIPADARQEFMRTVINETENLARLADDTLLITRMETGEAEYHWSEIDLGPFILDSVPLGLSEHSILMDIPATFPKILADPDRLRQVLTNLVTNAIKYSPGGGSITIRCRERGSQHVVLEVVDHGLGIPADQIPRLFQKFQRVRSEEHDRISGTGLGLYICRLIVEGHGGQIWVESELAKGSTFGLVLPLDARAAQAHRRTVAAARAKTPPASS
ncbi:MAG: GAF domain-containing protein [Acidobacteria bacterium]|nr:GAF domain-containing protein [Acidobacteriota bacterium]